METLYRDHILTALRTVIDPELHHNIVDLGMVYRAEVQDAGAVQVDITLTTPACPLAPFIISRINEALVKVQGVEDVQVNVVWDPPWTIQKIEPSIRFELFPNYIQHLPDSEGAGYIPPSAPSDSDGG